MPYHIHGNFHGFTSRIKNSFDLVTYIENLMDLPVSKILSRFDLALYIEISMDEQVAW